MMEPVLLRIVWTAGSGNYEAARGILSVLFLPWQEKTHHEIGLS
ncbi:hypothetical protein [uncultured Dialister sp.]|nr:hypothetical protein [uncultured Dialister sp.]